MNVLSLFDGMSCGHIALTRAGVPLKHYFASEIDKYAISISLKNYPNTTQLGDVLNWRKWKLPKIDLIMGGSPCQGFSFAGKGLNFNDVRSKLFFEFVDVLEHYNPKYFLLENVKMKKEYQDIISKYLDVEPIEINSSLVSAQNRVRLYWTNIPWIEQPQDLVISLKDVVFDDALFCGRVVGRRTDENGTRYDYSDLPIKQRYELRTDNKSGALTTVLKDNMVLTKEGFVICMHNLYGGFKEKENRIFTEKSPTLRTPKGGGHIPSLLLNKEAIKHIGEIREKEEVAKFFKTIPYKTLKDWNCIRKFHPIECERLQTVPDNYTEGVSNTQRYKMLGNGWTVEVIAHIFNSMMNDIEEGAWER
jgi:DNA (cytosine-5)-methyltransferase 3A